jgi:hypothetical protein
MVGFEVYIASQWFTLLFGLFPSILLALSKKNLKSDT